MFKFSTNTILNVPAGALAAGAFTNGASNWVSEDYKNPKVVIEQDKYVAIERLGVFRKGNVTKIFRRKGVTGTPGQVVIGCNTTANFTSYGEATPTVKGIYRLLLYIKLSGSNNSYFSNDFVFKGKPLAYEVELGDKPSGNSTTPEDGNDLARKLAEAITKESRRFGSKYIKATANGANLTIQAVGSDACYELFTQAELQKFDSEYNSALIGGEYRLVPGATAQFTPCKNPFGTYWQIMKDLRLPTADALRFGAIVADDRPALGVLYDQFIIYMCVDRGIMGGDAVGEITKSVTAHSIWVPSTEANNFAALFSTNIGIDAEEFDADYKKAGSDFTGWTSAPWNGVATTEAGTAGASATNPDNLDVTKGEAYAGVVGEAPAAQGGGN